MFKTFGSGAESLKLLAKFKTFGSGAESLKLLAQEQKV